MVDGVEKIAVLIAVIGVLGVLPVLKITPEEHGRDETAERTGRPVLRVSV